MIDWKNKPEGAQRYNNVERYWLKKVDGELKGLFSGSTWSSYVDQLYANELWNNATVEQPPLQLTWNGGAPAKATHILQHETSYTQVFATMIDGKLFETSDTTQGLPDGEWFIVSEAPVDTVTVESTINERGERYGKFNEGADIMQTLKNVMRETDGWERLTASQREALEMIQHKIGRVLNGDPTYDDNWRDICGYSQLILDELNGTKR